MLSASRCWGLNGRGMGGGHRAARGWRASLAPKEQRENRALIRADLLEGASPVPCLILLGSEAGNGLFLRYTWGFIRKVCFRVAEVRNTLPSRNRGLASFPFWLQKSIESGVDLHQGAGSTGLVSEALGPRALVFPGFSGNPRGTAWGGETQGP